MKPFTICIILGVNFLCSTLQAQSPDIGKDKYLIFHDIQTDAHNNLLPWYNPDPAISYDYILNLTWTYWKNIPGYWMRNEQNFKERFGIQFPPLYLLFRTQDRADQGIGGDQFAMMLSSFNLLYDYTGDTSILNNMVFQADWYMNHSFSDSLCAWPNLPYPCNTQLLPVYDGDLILGKGYLQPDKAGDFAYELVILYKKTSNPVYIQNAVKIANTLAKHTNTGDYRHSPLPFKVNAKTGEIGFIGGKDRKTESGYTSNWTGTMRLFKQLISLEKGDTTNYRTSFDKLLTWMKMFPVKNNRWGPFFEDIDVWSDTQINAGLMAQFILDNPSLFPEWRTEVRSIQDWVLGNLAVDLWKPYGLRVIGEQTVYKMQGQSHTSRHASIELRFAELSNDTTNVAEAIRQFSWCTYAVDNDGKNKWPNPETYEIWWTDGYGDYIRHFLRAMAARPELCPNQGHLLRTTSVVQNIHYLPNKISYTTFDKNSNELIRMPQKPIVVTINDVLITDKPNKYGDFWIWKPLKKGGALELKHTSGNTVIVSF